MRISDWSSDVCSSDLSHGLVCVDHPSRYMASSGNTHSATSAISSTSNDGTAARVTDSSDSCGSIDLIANKFMPTGGVMTDISILITMKIPNHMGSMPIASAIGKNTGRSEEQTYELQ